MTRLRLFFAEMTDLKLFFLILIVNVLVVLLYILLNLFLFKRRNRSFLLCSIVMLLCPVVGPCFYILALILFRLFYYEPVDLEDVVFSKARARTFIHAEEERESNLAPLEEAIEITEASELRTLMMSVVRGDIQNSLATIALAMNSEDTETAHYAASVLQSTLNVFQENVEKQVALIRKKDENRLEYADALVDYMNQVLEQKVLTGLEQERYVNLMEEVCEILFQEGPERMRSAHYEAISLRLLDLKEYERCEKWCLRAAAQYPSTLATYSCFLKLYFSSGQREKFFETIEDLKRSPVVIDRETLELIRVFQ